MTSAANTGALARLLEQATPGPWYRTPDSSHVYADDPEDKEYGMDVAQCEEYPDARLIALAPDAVRLLTDMAAIIAEVFPEDDTVVVVSVPRRREVRALLARFAALEERAAQ